MPIHPRHRLCRTAIGSRGAHRTLGCLTWLTIALAPGCARAQQLDTARAEPEPAPSAPMFASADTTARGDSATAGRTVSAPARRRFKSRRDSLEWVSARRTAQRSRGYRIIVSLQDRRLWVVDGADTAISVPVAVGRGTALTFGRERWVFRTPRGVRTVLRKESDPVWIPPEWLYAEVAKEYGLELAHLRLDRPTRLADGRRLVVEDSIVGVVGTDSLFHPLPVDEHIVFDSTLFVPPLGTKNRRVVGELGKFRLDLGDGYLLHGTPEQESIGTAATHGCVRLRDEDIEWLYQNIPVGTKVYIY